jgi:hypothetical protein
MENSAHFGLAWEAHVTSDEVACRSVMQLMDQGGLLGTSVLLY